MNFKWLMIILMTLMFWVDWSYADEINVAVLEFPPYICNPTTEDGKLGFTVELEKIIFEKQGYKINFHIVPYMRALKGTEQGRYDAVGLCNDMSSKVNICSTETVGPMIYRFYVKKGRSWRYNGVASMKNVSFGHISGYVYDNVSTEFHQYVYANLNNEKLIQTHHGQNINQRMIEKVIVGRLDTFSEASYVMDYIIDKLGYQGKLDRAGRFKKTVWGRMAFSPKNSKAREYVLIIDQGMREMRRSGELQKILAKYDIDEWPLEDQEE